MYKERKETTLERVGEKKTYINNINIKDKHNVCKHGHKAGVQEQGSKHST